MEQMSAEKEIAERNAKLVSQLTQSLADNEKKYISDANELGSMKKNEDSSYICAKNSIFENAKRRAEENPENFSFNDLEGILKSEHSKYKERLNSFVEIEADMAKNYNSSIESSFSAYLSQASQLIEKRIKDYHELKAKSGVNQKEVDEAKAKLHALNKGYRKSIKKGVLSADLTDLKKKYETIINKAEKNNFEKGAMEKYPIDMPVWYKIEKSGDEYRAKMTLPIQNSGFAEFKVPLEKTIFDEICKTENADPADSHFISYGFRTASHENLKKIKESVEGKIKEFMNGANVNIKIYETHAKKVPQFSQQIQPFEKTSEAKLPEKKERLLSIREASELSGIKYRTLSAMVIGSTRYYKNHPVQKFAIKEKTAGGKSLWKIKEEGLSVLSYKHKVSATLDKGKALESRVAEKTKEKTNSRLEILEKGLDYVSSYVSEKGNVPTIHSWKCENLSLDSIKEGWRSYSEFLGDIMKSKPGKKARKGFEKKLSEQGFSTSEIANKLKIAQSSINRDLEETGVLTGDNISRNYNSPEKIKSKKILGFKKYDKEGQREDMLCKAIESLAEPEKINYLGLEGPNFGSFITISNLCKINQSKSLIAERDLKAYNAMCSIRRNSGKIKGGEIFSGLNIYKGDIADAISSDAYKNSRFNFINLDYTGALDPNKLISFNKLFENGLIDNQAVLFMTFNIHPRKLDQNGRALEEIFKTSDPKKIIPKYLDEHAENYGFNTKELFIREYNSGIIPMLTMGYKLEKKK